MSAIRNIVFRLTTLLLIFSSVLGYAQGIYPVQVNTVIQPPFALNLDEYRLPGKFFTQIFLADRDREELEVYLKLSIKGPNNFLIETTDPTQLPSITLTGGGVTTITSDEYSYLFKNQNLTKVNAPATWEEGFYIFNIEVIEKKTGIAVSNAFSGSFSAMIVKSNPPFLNMPFNKKMITATDPQPFITFNWSQPQVSLNSVFNLKYRLVVVRKATPETPDYQALLSPTYVLDIETTNTSFNWDMTGPLLVTSPFFSDNVEGSYAWQVQVIDETNSDQFKNDGWSEAFSFNYVKPCDMPELSSAILQPDNTVDVTLVENTNHTMNELHIKELGARSFTQKKESELSTFKIGSLDELKTYEIHGRAKCGDFWTNKTYLGSISTTGSTTSLCSAPQTIEIKDGRYENTKVITWESSNLADQYRIYVEHKDVPQELMTPVEGTTTTITLLPENYPAKIRIDAVCGSGFDAGRNIDLTLENASGFVGECSFPSSNGFAIEGEGNATWGKLDEHVSFEIRYKKEGESDWSPVPAIAPLSTPAYAIEAIEYEEQYEYQLKYNCATESTDWSETKTFILDGLGGGDQNTSPSGTCMPPHAIIDELQSETSIEIEWDKVDKIKSYELIYKVVGPSPWVSVAVSGTKHTLDNLMPNTAYVYQVRSLCDDGESVTSKEFNFKTDEPVAFSKDCPKVEDHVASAVTETQATIGWTKDENHTDFFVMYKEDSQSISDWYQHQTPDPSYLIDFLKPGVKYNVKVQAVCGTTGSAKESTVIDITTLAVPKTQDDDFECGAESKDACDQTGTPYTDPLPKDQAFMAYDFNMVLNDAISESPYSGMAKVVVPYMNKVEVNVELKKVTFSVTEKGVYCMTGGKIITKGMTLKILPDALAAKINGVLDEVDAAFDVATSTLDQAEQFLDQIESVVKTITEPVDMSIYEGWSAEELYKEGQRLYGEGKTLYEDIKGGNATGDIGQALTNIKTGAELIKMAAALSKEVGSQIAELDDLHSTSTYFVEFKADNGEEDTFDAYDGTNFSKFYQRLGTAEEGVKYHVPYMAISKGAERKTIAEVTIPNFEESKLHFVSASLASLSLPTYKPIDLKFNKSGNKFEITVPADAKRVYAIYETEVNNLKVYHRLAKLKIVEIEAKTQKVVIVPNSSSHKIKASDITKELNEIYDVPGVTFEVNVVSAYTNTDWDAGDPGIQVDDHKFMSRSSPEMKNLENKYFASGVTRDDNAVYLFVVSSMNGNDGSNILGYMPRKKDVGFLAANPNIKTIAHELGHGVFRLAHTWDLDADTPEGSTQNLMDYANGKELLGAQWQQIQDPSFDIYGLDPVDDGKQSDNGDDPFKDFESTQSADFQYCQQCSIDLPIREGEKQFIIDLNGQSKFLRCFKGVYEDNGNGTSGIYINDKDLLTEVDVNVAQSSYGISYEGDETLLLRLESGDIVMCHSDQKLNIDLCKTTIASSSDLFVGDFNENLHRRLSVCFNDFNKVPSISESEVETLLKSYKAKARSNQEIEFSQGGFTYSLDANSNLAREEERLTNEDIIQGEWDEKNIESRTRLFYNELGIIQVAIGFQKDLEVLSGKTANIKEVSESITNSTNKLFTKLGIDRLDITLRSLGKSLDSEGPFPDGNDMDISEDAWVIEIVQEGVGIVGELLKTAEFEKKVYEKSSESVIKGPPVVTGVMESAASVVTDITSLATTVYDLVVDEDAQKQAIDGLKTMKDQVSDDFTKFYPILWEVILSSATGTSSEEFDEIENTSTDEGRQEHLIARAGVSTIVTIFTSAKFLTKLPELAEQMLAKMAKGKGLLNFTTLEEAVEELAKRFRTKVESLGDRAQDFLDDFKDATNEDLIELLSNESLVDAWGFVRVATGSSSAKKLSIDILESVSKHLDDADFMTIIGNGNIQSGKSAFGELINKYAGKCQACTGGNPSQYLPENPKEYIDKVVELTKRYSDKNGIDIFKEAKKGFTSQEGAWHAMQHLDDLDPSTVKRIDAKFEGEGLPCEGCRFDVELIPTSPNPLKLIEYKSYLDASKIPFPQFKNYLNDVTNLNQFNYVFSKSKLDLAGAKNGVKNFLKNNADELFKDIPDGGIGINKMKQLFEMSPNIQFENATQFKALLENNSQFRNNALSFVKTN